MSSWTVKVEVKNRQSVHARKRAHRLVSSPLPRTQASTHTEETFLALVRRVPTCSRTTGPVSPIYLTSCRLRRPSPAPGCLCPRAARDTERACDMPTRGSGCTSASPVHQPPMMESVAHEHRKATASPAVHARSRSPPNYLGPFKPRVAPPSPHPAPVMRSSFRRHPGRNLGDVDAAQMPASLTSSLPCHL